MKRCPECRRDYYDDTLSFCLEDGTALVQGSVPSPDEPVTAILSTAEVNTAFLDSGVPDNMLNSIAVLPFEHMSSDDDNEYFCDGLAEELINALSKIDALKVASRTSAFSFKGKETDIHEIAKKLGVKTELEGSVRKAGDRFRVTAQLINAADGYHLWSERYDREMKDVFAVQDEITLGVVDALKLKLLGASKAEVLKHHTDNPEAHKAYLLGRYLRHTKNDHGGARQAFGEAVRLDPSHAPSWVGLAEGTVLAAHYSLVPARDACERAKVCLATAEEMQGESADAFYIRGFIAYIEADWPTWEASYRRAIALRPDHVQAYGSFALTLCLHARFDEAFDFFERSRAGRTASSFSICDNGRGSGNDAPVRRFASVLRTGTYI